MKTRYGLFIVVAMVAFSTLLACSVTQIFPSDKNSPLVSSDGESSKERQNTDGGSSEESQNNNADQSEETQAPIVGTWKQIQFQGVGGRSNLGLGGYTWFGDYYYVGTYNMGFSVPQQSDSSSGGGQPSKPCPAPGPCPTPGGGGTSGGQIIPQPSSGGQGNAGTKTGAEIWRTLDGTNWEVVGEPGLGYPNITVFQPILFQNRIYVFSGTKPSLLISNNGETFDLVNGEWSNGNINNMLQNYIIDDSLFVSGSDTQKGQQAWLSTNGKSFAKVIQDGLGDSANKLLCGTTVDSLNGWYYLGVMNNVNGGELWRTKNGRTWEKSLTAGSDDPANTLLCSLLKHNDYLYVTIPGSYGNSLKRGVEVIRTADGENWEKVIENGFGLGGDQGYTGGFSVYKNAIYFLLSNFPPKSGGSPSTGFRLLRSLDGKTWRQVGEPGFGAPDNYSGTSHVIRDVFYLVTQNIKDGNQIWRSSDGMKWELFHTFPASETNYGHHLAELADGLEYFEYDMSLGIQIWRYGP